ncbi:MAG: cytochrome c peroxidase [Planctomycetota bacterium]
MRSSILLGGLSLASVLVATSCSDDDQNTGGSPLANAPALDTALARAAFNDDHPYPEPAMESSPELIALGRDLYHDGSLSTQGNQSCATCHDLNKFGQDGEVTSLGSEGERGERNSPTTLNAFRQVKQFWDSRAATVEEQAQGPVVNPIEHGFESVEAFEVALKNNTDYIDRFAALFPEEGDAAVTIQNFGAAVGAFERTLVTRSRFDDFIEGDESALTAAEKTGLAVFMAKNCHSCHKGRTLGGGENRKLGEIIAYEGDGYSNTDKGVGAVTGQAFENYFFKVPMLLNVAETAPYHHDGSVPTLEVAVKRMSLHQLGKDLSDAEAASIVTFLKSLTGELQAGD